MSYCLDYLSLRDMQVLKQPWLVRQVKWMWLIIHGLIYNTRICVCVYMGFPMLEMQETWLQSPGGGHGNLLQCFCLENSRQEESSGLYPWGHKSQTWLSKHASMYVHRYTHTHTHTHTHRVKDKLKGTLLKEKWKLLSCVRLFVTPWTLQFMEFSRPEYWSGKPFPSPGESSQPRDQTQVSRIAGRFFTSWTTREAFLEEMMLKLSTIVNLAF